MKIEICLEEYKRLRETELKLDMLEWGGVDNWNCYGLSFSSDNHTGKSFDELREEMIQEIDEEYKEE